MERRAFVADLSVVAVAISVVLLAGPVRAEERFLIVQPGYPGSTDEAKGFVEDLSRAIGVAGGPKDLTGVYFNSEAEALQAVTEHRPAFGIVSLGFFLAHRKDLAFQPLLESRPADRFYLVSRKGQSVSPSDLAGQVVEGTPFHEKEFLARIVFGAGSRGGNFSSTGAGAGRTGASGAAVDISKWKIEPTTGYSKALRDVAKGKARAALLTGLEERAMKDLAVAKELEVVWKSEDLPTAIVVSFGEPKTTARQAVKALEDLKGTAEGNELLKTMGIDAFAPVEEKRLASLEVRWDAGAAAGGTGAGRDQGAGGDASKGRADGGAGSGQGADHGRGTGATD